MKIKRPFGRKWGFVGARPVEGELSLEDLGVRVRLRAVSEGGHRIVHPRPAANGEFEDWTQCVGTGGVAGVHAGKQGGRGVRERYRTRAAGDPLPSRSRLGGRRPPGSSIIT